MLPLAAPIAGGQSVPVRSVGRDAPTSVSVQDFAERTDVADETLPPLIHLPIVSCRTTFFDTVVAYPDPGGDGGGLDDCGVGT